MKRKIILILPLAVVTVTTIAFAMLHGQPEQAAKSAGLNTSLPGAAFDKHEKPRDKMSFYDQAERDSAKENSNSRNPLLQQPRAVDTTVDRINQKLAAIDQQVNLPQPVLPAAVAEKPADRQLTEQVSKLEALVKTVKNEPDPEMAQLSAMLGKIQEIQHPRTVLPQVDSAASPFKAIAAVIDGKQKIKQAGAVQLKLLDTLIIRNTVIPKGTLVFGTASISQQRLLITIKNIRLGQLIVPADLVVYALDGMPGVPAPEAELGEAAGEGAVSALQNMQFLSMDQSLATQAATSGINAARSLIGKKVKRITVHLKDGEQVLLRDTQVR